MNFEFSPEQLQLRHEARRFLEARCPASAVRAVLEGDASYDRALWAGIAEMGFLGVRIPEAWPTGGYCWRAPIRRSRSTRA